MSLQPLDLDVALAHVVGARGPHLRDRGFEAQHFFAEGAGGGLGGS
jgi:hypothetical protein